MEVALNKFSYVRARGKVSEPVFVTVRGIRADLPGLRDSLVKAGIVALVAGFFLLPQVTPAEAGVGVYAAGQAYGHAQYRASSSRSMATSSYTPRLIIRSSFTPKPIATSLYTHKWPINSERHRDNRVMALYLVPFVYFPFIGGDDYDNEPAPPSPPPPILTAPEAPESTGDSVTYEPEPAPVPAPAPAPSLTAAEVKAALARAGYSPEQLASAVPDDEGVILLKDKVTQMPTLFSLDKKHAVVKMVEDPKLDLDQQIKDVVYLRMVPAALREQRIKELHQLLDAAKVQPATTPDGSDPSR